jgi:hypothetical protein
LKAIEGLFEARGRSIEAFGMISEGALQAGRAMGNAPIAANQLWFNAL